MAMVDWRIQGYDYSSCNCDWGCPCQVMAPPTQGNCRAAVGFEVTRGHFGKVTSRWPDLWRPVRLAGCDP